MTVLPLTPDELLTTTRSVRKRLDLTRPVPMDLITECLQIALPETRAAIGELYRRSTERYLAARQRQAQQGGGPPAGSAAAKTMLRIRDSSAYLGQHMRDVPVQVIACIEVDAPWEADGNQAGLWGSVLPAAWSYMLAARARQLGTAWTTLHLAYEKEAADILGLPSNIRQGVLIPTAYYTGETFRPAPRRPVQEVMHLNHC